MKVLPGIPSASVLVFLFVPKVYIISPKKYLQRHAVIFIATNAPVSETLSAKELLDAILDAMFVSRNTHHFNGCS